ncbi:universal stress protein [Hyphomicrobium sp.]|uniref:universal stress protein n=1 Tax=Hyphomicrobium sp. TaxID=82 RepID=UPI0025B94FF7|nr:universal stress protein [Hyphomicrobium sp.]MCC7251224.1 universal stress protein [Hyphomicrobium sp.]
MIKVLCAIDDTEHSLPAARLAAKLAGALGAELTLLAVNQMIGGYSSADASKLLWTGVEAQRVLDAAAEEARKAGATQVATASVNSRDPAVAITQFAETNGFDHIVVGSGGKGLAFRMVLGSVSRDVVQRAHCAVTVAR